MSRVKDWLRGTLLVEVQGPGPERFLNLCASRGVHFADPERVEEQLLRLRMSRSGYRRMAAEEDGFLLRPVRGGGIPQHLHRLRGRYVLLLMSALCLVGLYSLSSRVWRIEVSGNETVPTEQILLLLEQLGLSPGVKAAEVDSYALRNSALLRMEELIWLSVNVQGCRAEVQVRERTPAPPIRDLSQGCDIVADQAGLITSVRVYSGSGLVQPGQTVDAGDVLISGQLSSLLDQTRTVHALGEIQARTWYTLKAQIPLEYQEKSYTGEKTVRNSLLLGRQKINLYFGSGIPYDYCDKITEESSGELFGLMVIPLKIIRETYLEYVPVQVELPRAEAEEILSRSLYQQLYEQVDAEAVQASDIAFREEDGLLVATLYAECLEQIGQERGLQDVPEPKDQSER